MTNIKQYRKRAGLTQSEFAEKVGAAQSTVSQWENGTRIPSFSAILKIAKVLNISAEEIMADTENDIPGWKGISIKPIPNFTDEVFRVPLVATLRCGYDSCGKRVFDVLTEIDLPASYRTKYGEDIVLIKAIGESMLPTIRPRDMLICKPGDGWENGLIVVVNVEDNDTIKRIYKAEDGGIDLVPDNDKFRKMHFSPDNIQQYHPHVLGRIVRNMGQDL